MIQPNFRQLEMFQLLMKTRSLTDTARLMRISQPAVSQALRDLEAQLGLTLFIRGGGRIRPSDEAIQIQPEIERVVAQIGALGYRAAEIKDTRAGQISVAAIPVICMHVLPSAVASFRVERPRATLSLRSFGTADVVNQIKQEQVDLGFVFAPIDEVAAGAEPIFETMLACLVRPDHRLAAHAKITPDDLAEEVVIALTADVPPGLLLREALSRRMARRFVAIETNSASMALELVKAGAGIAVVDPLPMLAGPASGIVMRPLEPMVPLTIDVLFSRHRALPRIAVQFVRQVLQVSAVRLTEAGVRSAAL